MSSETITTALFLITTVVAASVLMMAIFPAISTMTGTFASTTHQSDVRIRTDFKIITTYASDSANTANVWMKNIGTESISLDEIEMADVYCGPVSSFDHMTYTSGAPGNGQWTEYLTPGEYDLNSNSLWDPGETLKVVVSTTTIPSSGNYVYFQFALPNGIWRSVEFTSVS
jgi:archaeal flagellar protein FlaG